MPLSSQLLFFFSALGAFNGLLLTAYLFFSKPATQQRQLLALLILAISLRVSKSIWFYFDPDLGKQFLQMGLSACFFIGPLLYFYIASSLGVLNKLRFKWTWHLGLLLVLTVGIGLLFPYQSNVDLWGWFYKAINYSWGGYIILSALLLFPRIFTWVGDNTQLKREELLPINILGGAALIWLAYFTASCTSYIVGALSFSFILYVTILIWLLSSKQHTEKSKPYADKKIDHLIAEELAQRLYTLMSDEKLFKNANLTLPILAKKMQISVPKLSQLLNDNLQKSFNNYVNEWRILEAKRLLVQSPKLTMELVAENCGYNSQSTFYSAFKQFENTTPAKFRKENQLTPNSLR